MVNIIDKLDSVLSLIEYLFSVTFYVINMIIITKMKIIIIERITTFNHFNCVILLF